MSKTRPQDMPELRRKMLNRLRDPESRAAWEGALEQKYRDSGYEVPGAGKAALKLEDAAWEAGELFHVNDDMTALAAHAGRTLPDFRVSLDDLPAPCGIVYYAGAGIGLSSGDSVDLSLLVRAATWQTIIGSDKALVVATFYVERAEYLSGIRPAPGSPASAVSAWREQVDRVLDRCGPLMRSEIVAVHVKGSGGIADEQQQTEWFEADRGRSDAAGGWWWTLVATWLLMAQEIVAESVLRPSRKQARRSVRAGVKRGLDDVRVVVLRHARHESHSHESLVEYQHRWIVRGHWRNQWYPSQDRHVPLWIAPHVKGPDGAPFLTGEKVYAWRR